MKVNLNTYIKAKLDTAGYKILTQSRENRKGGRNNSNIQVTLYVKKISFKEYISFEALTVKLDITTK